MAAGGGGSSHFARAILGLDDRQFRAGVSRANRAWQKFRGSMLASIGPLAGAAGIGLLGRSIIGVGATFEQQMANIKAVTKSSTDEMGRMEAAARKLGAETSFSATEVAEGMTILAKATGSASKAVSGIESVLKLAGSEGANMADTAELVISSMNAFGLSFEESGRVANVFAATAQNTRQSVERLKDSMKGVSAMGRELGLGLEETTAAMGILVDSGLEASSAGVLLRSALGDIIKAGGPMADALKGVSLRADGLVGVLDALSAAGISGEEVFKQFNIRGASTVAILQRQRDRFVELEGKITGTNAAWEAYNVQQDTTTMAWERVKSALSDVAIIVFQTFGTDLKGALDKFAQATLDSRKQIGAFFIDVWAGTKKATSTLVAYGRETETLVRSIGEGLERVNITDAIKRALIPELDREVVKKAYLQLLAGDEEGAEFLMNAARKHKAVGETVAEQFGEGWKDGMGATRDLIEAELAGTFAEIERMAQEQRDRLDAITLGGGEESALPEIAIAPPEEAFAAAIAAYQAHQEQVKATILEGARSANESAGAIMSQGTAQQIRAQHAAATAAARAHGQASIASAEAWSVAFAAITDTTLTGAERVSKIIGGMLKAVVGAIQRMVAAAIAAKINLEAAFSNMSIGGLGLAGIGLGLIANRFHSGGISNDEQLAFLRRGEHVMPPQQSRMFAPMLEAMRHGQVPQLAAAGGGGGPEVHAHIHVPAGSILYANDPIGVRQLAETLHWEIEKTVKRAFRE